MENFLEQVNTQLHGVDLVGPNPQPQPPQPHSAEFNPIIIFFVLFFVILMIFLCCLQNKNRIRRQRRQARAQQRLQKQKMIYVFIDPANPNQKVYAKYNKKQGKYKIVKLENIQNQYQSVNTVPMNMTFNPNLNYAPPMPDHMNINGTYMSENSNITNHPYDISNQNAYYYQIQPNNGQTAPYNMNANNFNSYGTSNNYYAFNDNRPNIYNQPQVQQDTLSGSCFYIV